MIKLDYTSPTRIQICRSLGITQSSINYQVGHNTAVLNQIRIDVFKSGDPEAALQKLIEINADALIWYKSYKKGNKKLLGS